MRKRHRDMRMKKGYTRRPPWKFGRSDACGILLLSNPEFIFMFALALIDDIEELAERGIAVPCETSAPLDEPDTRSHVRL
jgi:hypothetical protein